MIWGGSLIHWTVILIPNVILPVQAKASAASRIAEKIAKAHNGIDYSEASDEDARNKLWQARRWVERLQFCCLFLSLTSLLSMRRSYYIHAVLSRSPNMIPLGDPNPPGFGLLFHSIFHFYPPPPRDAYFASYKLRDNKPKLFVTDVCVPLSNLAQCVVDVEVGGIWMWNFM